MIGERPKANTEEFFRELYPGFPDERIYSLLAVAAENPEAHPKELKSLLKKKCRHLPSKSPSEVGSSLSHHISSATCASTSK